MNLNLNSPSYYSKQFGVDDEIYSMCRELTSFIKDKEYSDIICSIGIVPIVAPKEEIKDGKWKEMKKIDLKSQLAFVHRLIDYDEYCNSDINKRKELIIKNILDSVKSIHKKARFDYVKFKNDIEEWVKINDVYKV